MAAGWTVSGIYTTNTYAQAAHILRTSAVRVLVLESREQLSTTYSTLARDFPRSSPCLAGGDDDRSSTPSFAASARARRAAARRRRRRGCATPRSSRRAVASLVYTSGTTGDPWAVELTHASVAEVVAMMHARIPLGPDTVIVSYLPLSHIAAQGIDVFSAIYCGAEVHFADADALRGSLKATLLRVRPTLFFGVPRVWEKLAAAMKAKAAEANAAGAGPRSKRSARPPRPAGAAWYSPRVPELARARRSRRRSRSRARSCSRRRARAAGSTAARRCTRARRRSPRAC